MSFKSKLRQLDRLERGRHQVSIDWDALMRGDGEAFVASLPPGALADAPPRVTGPHDDPIEQAIYEGLTRPDAIAGPRGDTPSRDAR